MKLLAWFLLASLSVFAQDNPLSITWVGQACFILKSAGGPTVVADPPVASQGYAIPTDAADAVTISHNHTDHNNSAGVSGKFTLIDGRPVTTRQEMTAAGITFVLIPGFHDNSNGTARGQNTMVRWTQSGLKMAHFGDLGQEQLTAAQLADLRDLDVIFIPAGGFFTVSPERMAQYVTELRPRVAILMHYKTAIGGAAQTAGLPAVAAGFSPVAPVVYKPSTVTISSATLPAVTEVWVMEPRLDAVAVNAASFAAGKPVAPGSLVSVFGKFTGSATGQAGSYPLPRKIGETEVLVDGKAVPLFYASAGQINFQLPGGTAAGQSVAEIRVGGQAVTRTTVTVIPGAPGLFAAANADGSVNSASNPAKRGDALTIYGTGQGAVTPAVEDGVAAGASLSTSVAPPIVFLAGKQMPVQFSGLAPGFAGLWQINLPLTADAATGTDMELTVVSGGTSNRLLVSVRQ
jgi:uncharacterized protein (TIGR03437 family)